MLLQMLIKHKFTFLIVYFKKSNEFVVFLS